MSASTISIADIVRGNTREVLTAIGSIKLPLINPFIIETITIPKIESRKILSIFFDSNIRSPYVYIRIITEANINEEYE